MSQATLAVIAKAPVAGRVKTRLAPPLSLQQAAGLAEAALRDTVAAMAAVPDVRRVLVLDGPPGSWIPGGFGVVPQRGEGLDERLAAAFADLPGPTLIIGMDTPQVSPRLLQRAVASLQNNPAVLGGAADGGYWAIGLRRGDPGALLGVPMSSEDTLRAQRQRLRALGLRWAELPTLRDVDTFADALAVAAMAPCTRFARQLGAQPLPEAA